LGREEIPRAGEFAGGLRGLAVGGRDQHGHALGQLRDERRLGGGDAGRGEGGATLPGRESPVGDGQGLVTQAGADPYGVGAVA